MSGKALAAGLWRYVFTQISPTASALSLTETNASVFIHSLGAKSNNRIGDVAKNQQPYSECINVGKTRQQTGWKCPVVDCHFAFLT